MNIILDGKVYVSGGATLTIQAGTKNCRSVQ